MTVEHPPRQVRTRRHPISEPGQCALTLSTQLAIDVDGQKTALKVLEVLEAVERADPQLAQLAQMRYVVSGLTGYPPNTRILPGRCDLRCCRRILGCWVLRSWWCRR